MPGPSKGKDHEGLMARKDISNQKRRIILLKHAILIKIKYVCRSR
jgi:hypothetical protein